MTDRIASNSGVLIIKTMCPSDDEARHIAQLLLKQKLIAAGQISERESMYWWDGAQHHRQEWELSCVTQGSLYPAAQELIIANHSYQVPEVIGIPVVAVSESWAEWVQEYAVGASAASGPAE